MLARLRKATEENEGGFTLIELLVVMIIIGILAAIAIPAFLTQKKKARETSAKSDATNLAQEVAAAVVDGDIKTLGYDSAAKKLTWTNVADGSAGQADVRVSTGNTVGIAATGAGSAAGGSTYCVTVTPSGAGAWSAGDKGLQQGGSCP